MTPCKHENRVHLNRKPNDYVVWCTMCGASAVSASAAQYNWRLPEREKRNMHSDKPDPAPVEAARKPGDTSFRDEIFKRGVQQGLIRAMAARGTATDTDVFMRNIVQDIDDVLSTCAGCLCAEAEGELHDCASEDSADADNDA